MTRDAALPEHRYTPGLYQDITATDSMRRRSGAWSYITRTIAEGYPLTLSTHSLATKVLFDDRTRLGGLPKAIGVGYLFGESLYGADQDYDAAQEGESRKVFATHEVIVAGGTFNTPQLLKLSGVGPREELEGLEIPVIADVPGVVSLPQE